MNIEDFRDYCLSLKGTTEDFPFDEDTLVFKVMGKLFALTSLSKVPFSVNLKCNPEHAEELREQYEEVVPGYHMNKKHWNTITCDNASFSDASLRAWIDHSYELVVKGLRKKDREVLEQL